MKVKSCGEICSLTCKYSILLPASFFACRNHTGVGVPGRGQRGWRCQSVGGGYSGGIAGLFMVGGEFLAPLGCLASAFFDFAGLCFVRVAACYVLGAAAIAHGINISSFLKS